MPKHSTPKPIVTTRKITKKERKGIISDFHVLLKQKDTITRDNTIDPTLKKNELEQVEEKITQMGGLQRYQNASLLGVSEKKFDTSKWCIQQLKDSGRYKQTATERRMKVLDCGSITDSYRKHSSVFDVHAIDLNPRLPTVQQVDFFLMPCEDRTYDVIVLSLVLNFVTDPCRRAEMLIKCQRIIKDSGILFVVLPRPCVDHSRYLTHHHFVHRIMVTLGFVLNSHHMSPKLAFYSFSLSHRPDHFPYVRRSLLNDGDDRNNFSIIIRLPSHESLEDRVTDENHESNESHESQVSDHNSPPLSENVGQPKRKKKRKSRSTANLQHKKTKI